MPSHPERVRRNYGPTDNTTAILAEVKKVYDDLDKWTMNDDLDGVPPVLRALYALAAIQRKYAQ
jgi:hypothetical protein